MVFCIWHRKEFSFIQLKVILVFAPGHRDQWISPMNTHFPTPCLHQGTHTPPKSKYNSNHNGCPGFYSSSFQFALLPKGPTPCRLCDPRCLHFYCLYFLECACGHLCISVSLRLCALLCWMCTVCLTARIMMLGIESPWLVLLHICWKAEGKWHRCASENAFFVVPMHVWTNIDIIHSA